MPMPTSQIPPMIAPGVLCPKCKGPMTDERQNKRTAKSPDYQCANVTCTDASGKYRTGMWVEKEGPAKKNGTIPPTAAPVVESGEKPKLAGLYMEATQFVLDRIVPLYEKAEIGVSDEAVAAMVATLFIAKSKEL